MQSKVVALPRAMSPADGQRSAEVAVAAARHANRDPFIDLTPAINRLRLIATEADNHLVLGPTHPDAALLVLCVDIVLQRKLVDGRFHEYASCRGEKKERRAARWAYNTAQYRLRQMIVSAGKMHAQTPAGIFAKAVAVHASRAGGRIGVSLASDVLGDRTLRPMLWPREPVTEARGRVAP